MRELNNLFNEFTDFDLFASSELVCYEGSTVHGTYSTEFGSDRDVMAVCIPPIKYLLGLKEFTDFQRTTPSWDLKAYGIRKYINLLLKSNPNVISLLWLEEEFYIKKTETGQLLIDNRDIFSSQQAYQSFNGYAYNQLKRMQTKGEKGQRRKELIAKYGYDCFNCTHLIRLLETGIEFMETGQVNVKRPNASYLLEIKRGKYTLEQMIKRADGLFQRMEQAKLNSPLPDKPDYEKAENLLISILRDKILKGT